MRRGSLSAHWAVLAREMIFAFGAMRFPKRATKLPFPCRVSCFSTTGRRSAHVVCESPVERVGRITRKRKGKGRERSPNKTHLYKRRNRHLKLLRPSHLPVLLPLVPCPSPSRTTPTHTDARAKDPSRDRLHPSLGTYADPRVPELGRRVRKHGMKDLQSPFRGDEGTIRVRRRGRRHRCRRRRRRGRG